MSKWQLIIGLLVAVILISGCTSPEPPEIPINEGRPPSAELYLRYYYTAETVYDKIVISDSKITYTYFDDAASKCDNIIVAQEPCWSESDLTTKEAMLSGQDVEALIALLDETDFMNLENTYGGAGENQRYYSSAIDAKVDNVEKGVVYQRFPGAEPMPDGFKKVKDRMFELVDKYI